MALELIWVTGQVDGFMLFGLFQSSTNTVQHGLVLSLFYWTWLLPVNSPHYTISSGLIGSANVY